MTWSLARRGVDLRLPTNRFGGLASAASIGLAVSVLRLRPNLDADSGIFVSGAAAVLNGDRLYEDFFDHKDPLFYYVAAGATWLAGASGLFLLDVVWIVSACITTASIVRALHGSLATQIVAATASAVVLTHPSIYASGMTQLQAIALLLIAARLGLSARFATSGAVGALAVATKLPFGLHIAALCGLWLFLGGRRSALRYSYAFIATTGAIAAVLVMRGELLGYWSALRVNFRYADDVLAIRQEHPAPLGTMAALWSILTTRPLAYVAVLLLAGLVASTHGSIRRLGAHRSADDGPRTLAVLAITLTLPTLLLLAATTLFEHHLQVLGASAGILMAALLVTMRTLVPEQLAAMALVLLLVVTSDLPNDLREPHWPDLTLESPTALAVSDVVDAAGYPENTEVTYGVYGGNSEYGMVNFLPDQFHLACPDVYQFPWFGQDRLEDHQQCMELMPDIIVDNPLRAEDELRKLTVFDEFRARRAAFLDSLEFLGERAVPAGVLRVYARQTQPS